MRLLTGCASVFCFFLSSFSAASEEFTPEEINALFNRQIEVQKQPLTRSLNGFQKRGLSLITVNDVSAEVVELAPITSTAPNLENSGVTSETTAVLSSDTTTDTVIVTSSSSTASLVPSAGEITKTIEISDPNQPLVYAKLAPELLINLNIKFGFDSAALDKTEITNLSTMCTAMRSSTIEHFRIIGHTDTSGADEYNARLSVLRAKEVARYLVQDCGIEASRLETVGMGERFPINTTDTDAEENRRVEFQALS